MASADAAAKLRKIWPGVPIISFNSFQDATNKHSTLSANAIKSPATPFATTTLSPQEPDKCCRCGKGAQAVCIGCKGCPAQHDNRKVFTRYCSKECQKEHWKVHKLDCKAAQTRRILYRSANLLKALFYVHQEFAFTWAYFDKIERHGRFRLVYIDQEKSNARKTLLIPFTNITNFISDPHEQEAFLTHLSCNEAIARFGPMFAEMLKGIVISIEEITVIPKDLNIEIVLCQERVSNHRIVRKDGITHTILRVTLVNEEQYAIDFSGAQYGFHQECLPWYEYTAARVDRIVEIQAFGATQEWLAADTLKKGHPTDKVQLLRIDFANELRRSVKHWTDRQGSVDALLALPEQEYTEKRKSLLKVVKTLVELKRDLQIGQNVPSQRLHEIYSLISSQQ
ncbi:MAG: hypothetical protein Q9218_000696 [Villophora microphyllina]